MSMSYIIVTCNLHYNYIYQIFYRKFIDKYIAKYYYIVAESTKVRHFRIENLRPAYTATQLTWAQRGPREAGPSPFSPVVTIAHEIHSPIPRKSAISGQRQPATAAPRRARSSHTAAAGHPLTAVGISIQQWRTVAAGSALCGDQCLKSWSAGASGGEDMAAGVVGRRGCPLCRRQRGPCEYVADALERERRGS